MTILEIKENMRPSLLEKLKLFKISNPSVFRVLITSDEEIFYTKTFPELSEHLKVIKDKLFIEFDMKKFERYNAFKLPEGCRTPEEIRNIIMNKQ